MYSWQAVQFSIKSSKSLISYGSKKINIFSKSPKGIKSLEFISDIEWDNGHMNSSEAQFLAKILFKI